ncbi:CDT1-like protein a, chloroplastic [Oryza glaberrima]|uniref:CDT1 Geminin-binding domain-containing protein n=1 Tax=Oryza barthii TaxID=65489 RepID=A0A0D3HF12_9ORYZ|nr:CDT1-like protein a, chloroplastic [Oryza glaberrima]
MTEGKNTQLDLETEGSSSPAATQKMKVKMEDSESKIESPTLEKSESRRNGVVISSLARNLLAERYKDRFAAQLLGDEDEDETDAEDDSSSTSPDGSSPSVSESIDISGTSPKDKSNDLLEKHNNLLNLFNRMVSSIRLLHLRKKMTTFKNIATQVEILTKREFLYTHLAQMKHLFPEAIQIKKILLHDEKSLCMYADMEITILMDTVESSSPDQSLSMAICEAFHSKLLSFLDAHHKDIDIPEAMLPEPFNSRDKLHLKAPLDGHSAEPLLQSSNRNELLNASHFPCSFQKLMSQKIIADGTDRTKLLSDPAELSMLSADDTEGPKRSSNKQDQHASIPFKTDISSTPNRHLISSCQGSTPKQGTLLHSPLMAETPAMQTPRRPLPTQIEKLETTSGQTSEARSASSARRSLKMFSPSKIQECSSDHDGAILTLEHEVTAGKCLFPDETHNFTNSLEENNPAICFADVDKTKEVDPAESQEKIASLQLTFDIVCDISRSTKNSLITKQELFHNILANNLEIEETGEIEEQLHILEDLSPDWISKKVIPGGDILYSIKEIADQKSVRARLVEVI